MKPGRHVRFCPKNPERIKGTPVGKSPAAPTSTASAAPEIVAKVDPVPPEKLPNFTPPPTAQPKPSAAGPMGDPQVPFIPSSVAVRPLVDIACNAFNARLHEVTGGKAAAPQPPAPISDEERKALSEVYGALADKYFPLIMAKWGLEAAALITTIAVFGPRVWDWWDYRRYQKQLLEAKKAAQAPSAGAYSAPPVGPPNGGSAEPWKDAYEKALQSGTVPR